MPRIGVSRSVAGALCLIAMLASGAAPAVAMTYLRHTIAFGGTLTVSEGIAVDSAGDLFATSFSPVSGGVVELPANGSGGYRSPSMLPFGTTLAGASGVAVDSAGDVFVANEVAGTAVELPASGAGGYGSPTTDVSGPVLNGPEGIAVDPTGNLFVANFDSASVTERVSPAFTLGPGQSRLIALPFGGSLDGPMGVAVDAAGDVFTTNSATDTVLELHANGSGGYSGPTVLPFGHTLHRAAGIAVDPAGDVFVASTNSGTVVELPPNRHGGYSTPIVLPFGRSLGGAAGVAVDSAGDVFALTGGLPQSVIELVPAVPSTAPADSPQLRQVRSSSTATSPTTRVYALPAAAKLANGTRAEAVTIVGRRSRVVGTGLVQPHSVAITFMHLTPGRHRVNVFQARLGGQPALIGHTTLVTR
jgi:hypothetical protein